MFNNLDSELELPTRLRTAANECNQSLECNVPWLFQYFLFFHVMEAVKTPGEVQQRQT